jgi:translation elongation factor EF-Tu-like GTPase
MGEMTVLRLAIEVLATAEGGRQGPVFDGYRGAITFGAQSDHGLVIHDTVLVFEDAEQVPPGGRATARAWVVAPEYLPAELAPGSEFDYVEGTRTVAHASVVAILRDSTPFPVHDIHVAKTRLLKPA